MTETLLKRGVGAAKLWTIGFGKAVPLRPNDIAENMAVNRRVEFIVASKLEAVTSLLSRFGDFACSAETATIPELCKDPMAMKGTFVAKPKVAASPAHATEGKTVTHQEVPINLTLTPPTKEVGAPTR